MALVAIALLIAVGNFVIDKDDPNVSEAQASETTNAVASRVVMFTMPHDIKVMKLRWKQAAEAEQDFRAALLYVRSGPGQWPVCGS